MRRFTRWACCALGVCFAVSTSRADYRVVVQEAHGPGYVPVQITPDAKYVWVVAGANDHVLQVIDTTGPSVVRRFFLPDRVQSADIDSASGQLAVSTHGSIYLGNLADEHLQEILPGVNGAVLLHDKAPLLAVLGQIPDPRKKERAYFSYHRPRELGVFDVAKKEWRFVRPTPIVVPHVDGRGGDAFIAMLFHEGALLAGGIGGSVGSMIPVTFTADVHLDLTTGKTRITSGPSISRGKILDDKDPRNPGARPREGSGLPPADKNVEYKRERDYKVPPPLRQAQEARAVALKKLGPRELIARFDLAEGRIRDTLPMPFAVGDARVQIAVRRFMQIVGSFGSHSAVLTLAKDGKYELGPTRNTSDNPFGRGQQVHLRIERPEVDLSDLITGKPILPASALALNKKDKPGVDVFFLEPGVLVRDAERLALYKRGGDKPLWTRPRISAKWEEVLLDSAGKTLALVCAGEPILAEVLRLEDGTTVGRVPRPDDVRANYLPMGLSRDGKRLAVTYSGDLRLYDVASGKLLAKHAVPGDPYWRSVHAWSGGWIVSGEPSTLLFDEATHKWGATIPFQRVLRLTELDLVQGKRLLLQGDGGQCCFADPTDGRVLDQWVATMYGQYRAPAWNAIFAGGKAMVRPTGWIPVLEVVDLRTLKIAVSFHTVPVDKSLGLIAFTPDGWWDASAGAERHVAVFHKGRRLDGPAQQARRNAKVIADRLAALWR